MPALTRYAPSSAAGATHSSPVVASEPFEGASLSLASNGPIVPILHAVGSIATKFAPYTVRTLPPSVGPLAGATRSTRIADEYVMIISDWLAATPRPAAISTVTAPVDAAGGASHNTNAVDTKRASTPTEPKTHSNPASPAPSAVSTKSPPRALTKNPPASNPVRGDSEATCGLETTFTVGGRRASGSNPWTHTAAKPGLAAGATQPSLCSASPTAHRRT
mmetsp:Transcript_13758/g.60067  ORF Transcript_13758/g.60067 Transcript_13758/m.60067 type:complete len:220 (+) Transcript_13758:5289-5948(+)